MTGQTSPIYATYQATYAIILHDTAQSVRLMDEVEFRSDSYQRVYQYIRRHIAGQNLDHFSYAGNTEGKPQDCLEQLLR